MNDFEAMRDYLLACADEPEPVSLGDALDRLIAATGEGEWETPYGTVRLRGEPADPFSFRLARGAFAWQPGDEPAEVMVARAREELDAANAEVLSWAKGDDE